MIYGPTNNEHLNRPDGHVMTPLEKELTPNTGTDWIPEGVMIIGKVEDA